MLHIRVFQLALRLAVTAFSFLLFIYCGLRVYTIYLGHRSIALRDDAAQIQIGASEDSILPLVARYGGVKWRPPPPGPVDDCVGKAACAAQNEHLPEYRYGIALSPFNVLPTTPTEAQPGRIHRLLTDLMIRTPSKWRDPFSLRDTWTLVDISIRARHVVAVHGDLYVEGRDRWLGNSWRLSAEVQEPDKGSMSYLVDGTFLTFPGNGGAGTVQYLTPAATPEQFKSAQTINERCITGFSPCRCLSDLTPLTFQYLSQHPDAGSSIQTDDCPYRLHPQ